MAKTSGQFKFRAHDTLGANAAEDDAQYLETCFVDTGQLNVLLDFQDPRRIVVGRTGSGKTALLLQLKSHSDHAIYVLPESLSLNYIANSTIIQFLTELGVNLDVFYKLLWRHIFAVEFFKERFGICDQNAKQHFLARILEPRTVKRKRDRVLSYITRFGDSFWEDTDYRTREITTKFDNELNGALKGAIHGISLEVGGAKKLSAEQTSEITQRCQEVVNSIQVQELAEIIDLVNEVLDDPQKPMLIIIDRLDESWSDDSIRYRLVRALIDTVREFGKVRNAKVVVALRNDLLDRVFVKTRDHGFQEEKYRSLYLPLSWSRADLIKVVDRRIDKLVADRYTKSQVTHRDIIRPGIVPKAGKDSKAPIDFFIDRTWMRPRDVIEFFNLCLSRAREKPRLTKSMILAAEGEYSRNRLRSLGDEWHADYPGLVSIVTRLLKRRPPSFDLGLLSDDAISDACLAVATSQSNGNGVGELTKLASSVAEGDISPQEFRRRVAVILHRVGVVALKTESFAQPDWAGNGSPSVSISEVDDRCRLSIHPALWRALGIAPATLHES